MSQLGPVRRTLIVLGVLLAACGMPSAANAGLIPELPELLPEQTPGAFYVPPSPLPAGKPGDIIRWEKMDFSKAITKPRKYVRGYMVMYLSTSATGEPIAVTGTVLVPNERPRQGVANRPIIGYGNEAQGLGDNCAVSRLMRLGHTGELALIDPMLARGYAVASTDYEGLGTPAVHTFGVTASAAHAVLDIVRAARNLDAAMLPKRGQVALFGYSQGGAAVGGAAEIQSAYAPDVKLTATALGGPPIEPVAFVKKNDGGPFSSVNFAAAAGFDAAYPELDLSSFLNFAGKEAMTYVYSSCIESIATLAFRKTADHTTSPILESPKWLARFKENTLGYKHPTAPTLLFHAINDEASPFFTAVTLRRQWCRAGTNLRFDALQFFDHVMAGPQWMPRAAEWVEQRLEGKPTSGNCGALAPRVVTP